MICTLRDPVAVPQRLEDGVGEPQEHDVHGGFLAEEVVDAEDLPLGQMLSQLVVEGASRGQVVAEGLLDHDPGAVGQVGAGQAVDHLAEQRRRDLQVEHRGVLALDRLAKAFIGFRVVVVSRHHRQSFGKAVEDRVVDGLAAVGDRRARVGAQFVVRPVAACHADDGAIQQLATFQPVQGPEGHLLGQVSGDAEDHQHVGR